MDGGLLGWGALLEPVAAALTSESETEGEAGWAGLLGPGRDEERDGEERDGEERDGEERHDEEKVLDRLVEGRLVVRDGGAMTKKVLDRLVEGLAGRSPPPLAIEAIVGHRNLCKCARVVPPGSFGGARVVYLRIVGLRALFRLVTAMFT